MLNQDHNDGIHIDAIIAATTCKRHKADEKTGCWNLLISASQEERPAVCNNRIKRAGFNGKIQPASLSRWTPTSRNNKTDYNKLSRPQSK